MPEIRKFESRIIAMDKEMNKNNQIIQEFDKSISQKANKVSTRDFEKYVNENFQKKGEANVLLDKMLS